MMLRDQVQLSVVVPTFNEKDNVAELVRRLEESLVDIAWEVVFVDDFSRDGTAECVRRIAASNSKVRLIMRHNRRGLSSAVIEGALAAAGDVIAVMDGDLQHDESVLPKMYELVASDQAEIASASRFLLEDGADGLSSDTRLKISNTGIALANKMFNLDLTDPLTGFFVFRRSVLERAFPNLSEIGFKILLDMIASAHPAPRVVEVPFKFRERVHGDSKLDNRVMYDFFLFFLEKKLAPIVPLPAQVISFAIANTVGLMMHMAIVLGMVGLMNVAFEPSQLFATLTAITFIYGLNNALTYSDRRIKGWRFYRGLSFYALLSAPGVAANLILSTTLLKEFPANAFWAPAAIGALVTVSWNYIASKVFDLAQSKISKRIRSQKQVPGLQQPTSSENTSWSAHSVGAAVE